MAFSGSGDDRRRIERLEGRASAIEKWVAPSTISTNGGGISLLNGWTAGSALSPISIRRFGDGTIEFSGVLDATAVSTSSGSESTAFTLPRAWRPLYDRRFHTARNVDRSIAIAYVAVYAAGTVKPYFTTGDDLVYLDGITIRAEQ